MYERVIAHVAAQLPLKVRSNDFEYGQIKQEDPGVDVLADEAGWLVFVVDNLVSSVVDTRTSVV